MKKALLASLLGISFLVGCSSDDAAEPVEETKQDVAKDTNEPTQEELDTKLKEESVPANFVELNIDNPKEGKKVTATGEVGVIYSDGVGGTFSLTTNEDNGFGMYTITNLSLTTVEEGQTVTIYGTTTAEKADDGTPQITATIIE